jgi:hypothetical protein
VLEARGFDNSYSETEEGAVTLPQDTLVIRPVNSEDSAGPCDRDIVEEPHTLKSHVICEAVRMECIPLQDSPCIAMHHGNSRRRYCCVIFSKRWSYIEIFFDVYLSFDRLSREQKKKIWLTFLSVPRCLLCTFCQGKLDL